MLATVTRTLTAACALAMLALTAPANAQTGATTTESVAPVSKAKYMAVAWEGDGYLVTENGGKSWKLVYGNAISSLPEPILRLLKANANRAAEAPVAAIPNPATGPVDIRFMVDEPGEVTILLHDLRGGEVLRESRITNRAGAHSHRLDLSSFPSGIYYYRLVSGSGPIGSGTVTVTR